MKFDKLVKNYLLKEYPDEKDPNIEKDPLVHEIDFDPEDIEV